MSYWRAFECSFLGASKMDEIISFPGWTEVLKAVPMSEAGYSGGQASTS
jgi:hypothetical protein